MNDTNDTVVYRHRKPCGEVFYIGIGCEQRPYNKKHRSDFWKRVVKKYPDYVVEVVATGLSWEDACELEELMILEYGRRDLGLGTLVNLTSGGDGLKNPSKEIREKIGNAQRGKKLSKKTKQKISAAKQNMSKETREKIGNAQRGKKLSKKTRQKMSAAHKGENAPWYGKKFSKEHRQKISNSMKGKNSGENNPMCGIPSEKRKLTFEQAQEIRKRYQTKKTSHRKLAQEYGVSFMTISNIINNKVYKY